MIGKVTAWKLSSKVEFLWFSLMATKSEIVCTSMECILAYEGRERKRRRRGEGEYGVWRRRVAEWAMKTLIIRDIIWSALYKTFSRHVNASPHMTTRVDNKLWKWQTIKGRGADIQCFCTYFSTRGSEFNIKTHTHTKTKTKISNNFKDFKMKSMILSFYTLGFISNTTAWK